MSDAVGGAVNRAVSSALSGVANGGRGGAVSDAVSQGSGHASEWGQLTYSSFGAGGYAIGGTTGQLSDAEQQNLAKGLVNSFGIPTGISNEVAPTSVEIANRPKRLTYIDGYYWYAIPAGLDSAGRPGVVFNQAFVDRNSGDHTGEFRPIDLWDSSELLEPYGSIEVTQSRNRLAPELTPGPWGAADKIVDFLPRKPLANGIRQIEVLGPLLDAVADALVGGPPVVLGVANAAAGARWIAAVSHLLAAPTAARLNFSSLEPVANVPGLVARGAKLICVPDGDLAGASALPTSGDFGGGSSGGTLPDDAGNNNLVIISESGPPTPVAQGWQTANGTLIPSTSFSALAGQLQSRDPNQRPEVVIPATLEKINEFAAQPGSASWQAVTPLALAIASLGLGVGDPAVQAAASSAVAEALLTSPRALLGDAYLEPFLDSAYREIGAAAVRNPQARSLLSQHSTLNQYRLDDAVTPTSDSGCDIASHDPEGWAAQIADLEMEVAVVQGAQAAAEAQALALKQLLEQVIENLNTLTDGLRSDIKGLPAGASVTTSSVREKSGQVSATASAVKVTPPMGKLPASSIGEPKAAKNSGAYTPAAGMWTVDPSDTSAAEDAAWAEWSGGSTWPYGGDWVDDAPVESASLGETTGGETANPVTRTTPEVKRKSGRGPFFRGNK